MRAPLKTTLASWAPSINIIIIIIVVKWRHRANGLVNEHSYAANQNKDHSIRLLKILAVPIPTIKLSLWNQCYY